MEATLDRFGRVVIPKVVRDRLGLAPGSVLEVDEDGEQVRLRPVGEEPLFRREGNVLVHCGKLDGDPDLVLEELRRERIRHLAGLANR